MDTKVHFFIRTLTSFDTKYDTIYNADELQKAIESEEKITMKTMEEYLNQFYRMVIFEDFDEGGYVISFPDLPGCITSGETIESALHNAQEAKKEWILAALEEGISIPEPNNLDYYSGQFKLRIPKSLHRSLAEHAKEEGISMNQYCVYLLSKNDALYAKKSKNMY